MKCIESWAPVSSNPDTCLFPLVYKGIHLDQHYRIDLIVEDAVVVEVKSVATTVPVHKAQALTYMKLTNCPAGLVINFNVPRLMDGVTRLLLKDRLGQRSGGSESPRSHEETE